MAHIAAAPGTGYGNPYLDSLIWGCKWEPDNAGDPLHIAYFFGSGTDPFGSVTGRAWQVHEQDAFRTIFQLYENVANITFDEVNSYDWADTVEWLVPETFFDSPTALGEHEVPDPDSGVQEPLYGYYNSDAEEWDPQNLVQGGYGFLVAMHELGHMLGLAHPHDGGGHLDATTFPGVTYGDSADKGDYGLNQGIWTTMSYNAGWDKAHSSSDAYGWQGTPMAFDIAALQALYGANMTFHTGDDVYALPLVNQSGIFWSCIWDAGGDADEIDGTKAAAACSINLNDAPLEGPNAGGFVSWMVGIRGGFTIANGVVVENAAGGKGADTLAGNEAGNILAGNAGNDSLVGGDGDDTSDGGLGTDKMAGGKGDDLFWVDTAADVIVESAGEGTDTVKSIVTLALAAEVERLELQGSTAINGTGNAIANVLVGNAAANILDGSLGNDTMQGAQGDDTYLVDSAGDKADESGGSGIDTVKSTAGTYTLDADVENLTLVGAALAGLGNGLANLIVGTTSGNSLSGLDGNDSLNGGSGNDTLDGGKGDDTLDGAAGIDAFIGSSGNDLYRIDVAGDIVQAGADDGTDTVESKITFILGTDQENLTLVGTAAINATGNGGGNVITGNAAANILDGLGGVDTLIGGAGNDIYVVDDASDKVTEADKDGTDLVKTSQSYVLSPGGFVENLLLLAGAGSIDGTGNGLANIVTGNTGDNGLFGLDGNDTLAGGDGDDTLDGGAGKDAMSGGLNNDVYVVDSASDKVTEGADGGRDRVESTIGYTLGANLEDLKLTSAAAINGIGNALANLLIGGSGANKLDGKAGADTLRGGLGDDIYVVDIFGDAVDESGGGGSDTIQIATAFDLQSPSISIAGVIENVALTGSAAINASGSALANVLTGNSGANKLTGLGGNDTLDGFTGADTLIGGAGDDSYVVDNVNDRVQEEGTDAGDLIKASIAIDLGLLNYLGIEDVALTGIGALKATGDEQDNHLTGNGGANLLTGKEGADTLDGGVGNDTLDGGVGADSLAGGVGNDLYFIDDPADAVFEADGEGTDTEKSAVLSLALAAFVENLVLLAGSAAVSGSGNDRNNLITGNAAANTLDGGTGADTLVGGMGNDSYLVDNAKDVVTEAPGAGTGDDTVTSTAFTYTLGANLENLVLGAGAVSGTGNTLNNTLTGNAADNTLSGGAGKDHLVGSAGNDTYVVDNAGDLVDEGGGAGQDTVQSSISFSLANGAAVQGAVENLTLTGSGAISGTGNEGGNIITGNSGANTLSGAGGDDTLDGGLGNDALIGGAGDDRINVVSGNDTLRYTDKLDGHDIIDNFDGNASGGQDVLNLDALFDALGVAAAARAARVEAVSVGGGSVNVQVDVSVAGDHSDVITVATLNLANPADAITVGQDIVVGS